MLRFGILSTASIAPRFIMAIRQSNHFEVSAIASRSFDKARDFATQHHIPHAYGSYDELLDSPEVDIIYICTPNDTHFLYGKRALLANKHVIIEKPLALHVSEAKELFDLADEKSLFIMEAMKSLFLPATQFIKEMITQKELRQIDMTQSMNVSLPKSHWLSQPISGGILTTSGSYTFEYIDYLLEKEFEDIKVMTIEEDGTTVQATITMKSDKVMVTSRLAMNVLTRNEAIFYFTDCQVVIKDYWKASQVTINDETITFPTHSEMIYEINHIHECMEKGWLTSPIASKERTLFSIACIEDYYYKMEYNKNNVANNDATSETTVI